MNFQKQSQQGWLTLVGIGVISALTMTGCDRSKDKDDTDTKVEKPADTEVTKSVPAVACDDPMVQDRLKLVLQTTLNQKAQSIATSYANQAEVSMDSRVLSGHINDVLIDIQKPTVLQATNSDGVTTCQASVSVTLPSQDLYQANQVYASAGRPSLQERLAEQNIRLNNNMLVDDSFSYVVGTQGGELKIRIAGQPAILDLVSDVVAGSMVQATVKEKRAQAAAQKAQNQQQRRQQQAERRPQQEEPRIRQPRPAQPKPPAQPTQPKPAVKVEPKSPAPKQESKPAAKPAPTTKPESASKPTADSNKNITVPTDKSIDMVIVEDPNATY